MILCYIYEFFIYICETSSTFFYSNLTFIQWSKYVFFRSMQFISILILNYILLSYKTKIIPDCFLPESPLPVNPFEHSESIQWNHVASYHTGRKNTMDKTDIVASRFIGEDINITVRWEDNLPIKNQEVLCYFKGIEMRRSNRRRILSTKSKYTKRHHASLIITNISYSDFGVYRCVQKPLLVQNVCSRDGICENVSKSINHEFIFMTVYLTKQEDQFASVRVKLGTVINIENIFNFNILSSGLKLSWLYKINGYNYSEACPDQEQVSRHIPTFHQKKYKTPSCLLTNTAYRCNFSVGICSKGLGIHEFAIIKKNKTGHNEIIKHPVKLLLKPSGTILSHRNHYKFYDQLMENMFLTKQSLPEEPVLLLMQAKEAMELRKYELLAILCKFMIVMIVNFIVLCSDAAFDKCIFTIVNQNDEPTYRLGMPAKTNDCYEKMEYDLFLSFSEADCDFVKDTVIPILENELKYRVCMPDTDMRPGETLWTEYSKCIRLSRKIIVILSTDYLKDALCNQMQFRMLILPMLCNSDKSFQEIFLLHIKECEVPTFYNQFLATSKWYEYEDKEVLMNEIKTWMKQSTPSLYNRFRKMAFRVVMMFEKL